MKNLFEYEILVNDVFYRGSHILDWVKENSQMDDLDKKAIQATIMEALVYKNLINKEKESLDIEHMCIVDNLNYYTYEEHPDVASIPLWMKEEYRHRSLKISGGIPVSIFLAKPTSNNSIERYCIYDMNTAASVIFEEATFYNTIYYSPTRKVEIKEQRPFVEVKIKGELYLIDTLTKRIFKSDFFKENFHMKIKSMDKKTEYQGTKKEIYEGHTTPEMSLGNMLYFLKMLGDFTTGRNAEYLYELEKSKEFYPQEWTKYELEKELFKSRTN